MNTAIMMKDKDAQWKIKMLFFIFVIFNHCCLVYCLLYKWMESRSDISRTQSCIDHISATAQCVKACELPTRPRLQDIWQIFFQWFSLLDKKIFSCLCSFILLSSDNVSQRTRPCLFFLWRVHLSLCPSLLPCPLTQSGLVSSLH